MLDSPNSPGHVYISGTFQQPSIPTYTRTKPGSISLQAAWPCLQQQVIITPASCKGCRCARQWYGTTEQATECMTRRFICPNNRHISCLAYSVLPRLTPVGTGTVAHALNSPLPGKTRCCQTHQPPPGPPHTRTSCGRDTDKKVSVSSNHTSWAAQGSSNNMRHCSHASITSGRIAAS